MSLGVESGGDRAFAPAAGDTLKVAVRVRLMSNREASAGLQVGPRRRQCTCVLSVCAM